MEHAWEWARALKNTLGSARSAAKREDSTTMQRLVEQAWKETCGGRVSPARPW
jgi:hypothetical protein